MLSWPAGAAATVTATTAILLLLSSRAAGIRSCPRPAVRGGAGAGAATAADVAAMLPSPTVLPAPGLRGLRQVPAAVPMPPAAEAAGTPSPVGEGGLAAATGAGTAADGGLAAAKQAFLDTYLGYGYGGRIDELYAREIEPQLGQGQHYLDYTASAPYWASLVQAADQDLLTHLYASGSEAINQLVKDMRGQLLAFFGANPDEYEVVYTRSASSALQAVGDMFPWTPGPQGSTFAYLKPNHLSLLGIRENARAGNATFGAVTEADVEAWLSAAQPLGPADRNGSTGCLGNNCSALAGPSPVFHLFGYPAFDNYNGALYPLSWVKAVQAKSNATHKWKVLLDTTAFVITRPLNLTEVPADFICVSFYKMFGYPTGVGALIMRRDAASILDKRYSGGGSTAWETSGLDWRVFGPDPGKYEDGTLPFLSILALKYGLDVYRQLGGVGAIQRHTDALALYFYQQATSLSHSNGAPLLKLNSNRGAPGSNTSNSSSSEASSGTSSSGGSSSEARQGANINFSILDPSGQYHSWLEAGQTLVDAGFWMNAGCFCNPGQCYESLGVRDVEVRQVAQQAANSAEAPDAVEWVVVDRPAGNVADRAGGASQLVRLPLGSIRASIGYMTRFEDVHALLTFLAQTYTDLPANVSAPQWSVVGAVLDNTVTSLAQPSCLLQGIC